jgi:hypothetical protein
MSTTEAAINHYLEIEQLERQRLKCSLYLHLAKTNNFNFLNQVQFAFRSYRPETLEAVIAECEKEGTLVRITGSRGAAKLARAIKGIPLNPLALPDLAERRQVDDPINKLAVE